MEGLGDLVPGCVGGSPLGSAETRESGCVSEEGSWGEIILYALLLGKWEEVNFLSQAAIDHFYIS